MKNNHEDDRTRWPWGAQLVLAIVALVIACGLLIGIPMHVASMHGGVGPMDRSLMAMIVVFVGLTTMTISGMFIFMTFRIDRGAKAEAREEAQKVVKTELVAEITKAKNEAKGKVKKAGDDAVEKVGEIRDHEVIPKVIAAGKKVEGETDQMIEEARRRIGEADIKKLVNERLDAFLEQADGWPRRLFLRFLRPREPRS